MSSHTISESREFLGQLEAMRGETAAGPEWLGRVRQSGLERFRSLGLPGPRLEEWKNTNLAPLATTRFTAAATNGELQLPPTVPVLGGARLVFVDGRLRQESSTPLERPGVWVGDLATALAAHPERIQPHLGQLSADRPEPFRALNDAFLDQGAVILLDDDTVLEQPVQLVYYSSGGTEDAASVSHPRTLIVAGRSSQARIVEQFVGAAGRVYLTNAVTQLELADNATIDHVRVQMESESAFHLSTIATRQGRDSNCSTHNVNLGGRLVRHDVRSVMDGEGGECNLFGLYLTHGEQHVDNHTTLDHAQPHCDSRELYKGILDGRSRAVFSGRIIVRQDAQKTDAKQSNPNLLLSRDALAHTRPQLEIYADDVKCTHGATIGRMDEQAVFYLRSRGIGETDARNMLVRAFAGEVLEAIVDAPLRDMLEQQIGQRLDERESA